MGNIFIIILPVVEKNVKHSKIIFSENTGGSGAQPPEKIFNENFFGQFMFNSREDFRQISNARKNALPRDVYIRALLAGYDSIMRIFPDCNLINLLGK